MEITRIDQISVTCPNCHNQTKIKRYPILNQQEYPKLKRKLIDTSFWEQHCSKCRAIFYDYYPMIYIDEKNDMFFSIALKENEFDDLIKSSYKSVPEMLRFMKFMNESTNCRRIDDMYELSEKISLVQSHYDDRLMELMKYHMIQKLNENGENIQNLYYRNTENGTYLLAVRKDGSTGHIPFSEMWYQAIAKSYRNLSLVKENRLQKIDQDWARNIIRPLNIEEDGEGISFD